MKKSIKIFFLLPAVFLMAVSCSKVSPGVLEKAEGPIIVGVYVASDGSRTIIDEDWVNVNWQACDELAVWAKNSSGAYTLDATKFASSGAGQSAMVFTAELPSPMGDDTYIYTACYPYPQSISGTEATFVIPSEQDGRLSCGADILVSDAVQYGPLTPVSPDQGYSGLRLNARHLLHILKFYLPEGFDGLHGEAVKRIKVEMPYDITGELTVDMANPSDQPVLTNGSKTEYIVMEGGLAVSTADKRNYACAGIFPGQYRTGDVMKVTLYSDRWTGRVDDIPLDGRNMLPGHATPVALRLTSDPETHYTLRFALVGNNLGEPVQKITFATDKGKFGDDGAASYVWTPGGDIIEGDEVVFDYTGLSDFQALGGANITLTYDSEHVRSTQTITLPTLGSGNSHTARMTVPYLLWEDFSGVESFSHDDEYGTSSAGEKKAYRFNAGGWSGTRIGGSAGKCVRLAPRRETSARYHSRIDSAPLYTIKSDVTVSVSFNYSMAENHGGLWPKQYPTEFWVGYIRDNDVHSCPISGEKYGKFGEKYMINEIEGAWTNVNHSMTVEMELPAVDEGNPVNRISWFASVENNAGANNNTNWLYIDDVVVKVKR